MVMAIVNGEIADWRLQIADWRAMGRAVDVSRTPKHNL
jgi:hypothetical protein